jgi:thiol-disulfide isomerase/thioredoxin
MKLKTRMARRAVLFTALTALGVTAWFCISKRVSSNSHPIETSSVPTASQSSSQDDAAELMTLDLRGKAAPAFTLNDLHGNNVSLADFSGHAVVVNFWATYCEPCKSEMPSMESLQHKYSRRGLVMLGINQDEGIGKNEIATTASSLGVTYPILMPDRAVSKRYGGVDYLPETFYVDRNGTILAQTAGARTTDQIETDIRKVLGEGL